MPSVSVEVSYTWLSVAASSGVSVSSAAVCSDRVVRQEILLSGTQTAVPSIASTAAQEMICFFIFSLFHGISDMICNIISFIIS